MKKLRFYQYLAGAIGLAAVLCIVIGIIIGNKVLPFIGMILIVGGLTPLINPIIKNS